VYCPCERRSSGVFSRGSPRIFPPPRFAAALFWRTRGGVCWRVGFPVCCFPPCGVSPRGVWGLCPLRSSDDAVSMILSPHPEPTPGCSEPDSGWQSAAARPGTTLSVPAPGRPSSYIDSLRMTYVDRGYREDNLLGTRFGRRRRANQHNRTTMHIRIRTRPGWRQRQGEGLRREGAKRRCCNASNLE